MIPLSLAQIAAVTGGRLDRVRDPGTVTRGPVVIDARRATPGGVFAALRAMARGRRSVAMLGQMAELGEASATAHEEAGMLAARAGVAALIVVGDEAAPMLAGAKAEPGWQGHLLRIPDAEAVVRELSERLAPGDAVLVKASRVAGLERVAQAVAGGEVTQ